MCFNQIDFGNRLRISRKNAGLTQQELANLVLVEKKHISRLECGERSCSIDILIALSDVLNVSTDYLLKGNQSKSGYSDELDKIIHQLTELRQKL
jgi:transcriptional regulator with XRE-family HTH domain